MTLAGTLTWRGRGLPLAWLCNQTHRSICGEHPKDVYVHSISNQ